MSYINIGTYGYDMRKYDERKLCPVCKVREREVRETGRMRSKCNQCERAYLRNYKLNKKLQNNEIKKSAANIDG